MEVAIDGEPVETVEVEADHLPEAFSWRVTLGEGMHTVSVAFLNDDKVPAEYDRNLVVDRLSVTGPLEVPRTPPQGRDRVLVCEPTEGGEGACLERIVREFGLRAWRRPLSDAEVATKIEHYTLARSLGGDWNEGVRAVLKSLLLSPHFVYVRSKDSAICHPLSQNELRWGSVRSDAVG